MNEKPAASRIRQHGRKQRLQRVLALIGVTVFLSVFLSISAAMLILKRPEVSDLEKRSLAEFPSFSFSALLDGSYTQGIIRYFTDAAPYRDEIHDAGNGLSEYTGFRLDDVKMHGISEPPVQRPAETAAPTETERDAVTFPAAPETEPPETDVPETGPAGTDAPETEPPVTEPPETEPPETQSAGTEKENPEELLRDNGIIVLGSGQSTRAIMMYYGSEGATAAYAASLNRYKQQLGSGVRVWSMIIPTAVSYYLPEKYQKYTFSQKAHIDYSVPLLQDVKNVDAYGALLARVNEPIITRTDHHWAPLGAYYAAERFAQDAGVPFAPLSSYQRVDREGYVGTMYSYTGDIKLKNNPETFTYYKPANSYTTTYYNTYFQNPQVSNLFFEWVDIGYSYGVFLGTDNQIAVIDTDSSNDGVLLVVKDSYGNALIPFFTGSFQRIIVIDYRYFDLNLVTFCREQGVTDLLFAACAFSSCAVEHPYLEEMRTR
ncbi:MAG: hypothetical protein IJR89_07435 [Clostridia bacterium]|nr:hypothetical protein [Clostridia bacterium]